MSEYLPDNIHFIPAHPVAGTENFRSGFLRLRRTVQHHRLRTFLTPPEGADPAAVEKKLTGFGLRSAPMSRSLQAAHHDLVLAVTSHLPHLIAYTIVGTADELEDVTRSEVLKFSAGGFRDFTRIAASDPTMWRDVFSPTRTRCWKCSAPSRKTCRS